MTTLNSLHFQSLRKKWNRLSSKITNLNNMNITVLLNFFFLCFTVIYITIYRYFSFLFLVCFFRLLYTASCVLCRVCVCVCVCLMSVDLLLLIINNRLVMYRLFRLF